MLMSALTPQVCHRLAQQLKSKPTRPLVYILWIQAVGLLHLDPHRGQMMPLKPAKQAVLFAYCWGPGSCFPEAQM